MCAAIIGYGETELGETPDHDYQELTMWAVAEALDDADVTPEEVDGLVLSPPYRDKISHPVTTVGEYLGVLPITWGRDMAFGGASSVMAIAEAERAIEDGLAETVVVVAADNLLSRIRRSGVVEAMSESAAGAYAEPSNIVPSLYAHVAGWQMDEFGTTREQFAKVAEIAYRHASMQREERAHMNDPKTVGEIMESPMIADPFTRPQCSLISDGGGAFVVASDERARRADVPVELAGYGAAITHRHVERLPDFGRTGAAEAGERAMSGAGVSHDDVDVIGVYDCFPITPIRALEDMGFCRAGGAGALIESGDLELGGKWPMNTHGGLLAQVHPGLPGGMFHVTEAIRQLRGEAEATQVNGAETALVHGNGGVFSNQAVAVLQRGD